MKRISKVLFIILCITFVICTFCNIVYGSTNFNTDEYKPDSTTSASEVGNLKNIGNTIVGLIRTVGSIASVAVLIVLGIKFMASSLEERAKYKEAMIPYCIGAMLVFGITNILAVVIDIVGLFE